MSFVFSSCSRYNKYVPRIIKRGPHLDAKSEHVVSPVFHFSRDCEGKKRREHQCGRRGENQLRNTLLPMPVRLLDLSRIWRQRLAEIAIPRGHFSDQYANKSSEVTDFLPAHFSYRRAGVTRLELLPRHEIALPQRWKCR
jgi:hypothetical protein